MILLATLAGATHAQSPEPKRATVAWLQELQTPDGGFVPAPVDARLDVNPKGGLRATSSALRAIKYFGGTPRNSQAAAHFVQSCFDAESGGFSDQPGGKPDVFSTAVGMMAASELKLLTPEITTKSVTFLARNAKEFEDIRIAAAGCEAVGKLPPTAEAWRKSLASKANADGSFGTGTGKARATASTVVTILRLGQKLDKPDAILAWLNAGQNADGGFGKDEVSGSDLETSYRVMRCYHMLKSQPDAAKLRDFIAKCRNSDGGYGVAPGKPSLVSGTYFAAIILHWLGE
jgi:prenyltransferase beta subunit